MRCLIVIPSLRRAGAETQAVDLANGLVAIGHEVHVLSFQPVLEQRNRLLDRVQFHYVQRRAKYDVSLVTSIAQLIDRDRIEIVLAILKIAALISWLACKLSTCRPPVVAAVHTTTNRGLKEELQDRLVYRWILRRLPAVVFVCNFQRKYWLNKFPELESLAHVVYNGVDARRFRRNDFVMAAQLLRNELGIANGAYVFSCIAAFRPEKNHRQLIQAFALLPGGTFLLLAGDGTERKEIEEIVRATGLCGRVRFLGNVSDIRPVIVASDATVLPSTAVETFSMAMLESMALGVPMIATTIGGVAEAIVHGETGLLCDPGDVESLSAQMLSLFERKVDSRKLGLAAAECVAVRFTLEKMVAGYEEVLSNVVAASSRAPPSA